jgi:hypothetical protein
MTCRNGVEDAAIRGINQRIVQCPAGTAGKAHIGNRWLWGMSCHPIHAFATV